MWGRLWRSQDEPPAQSRATSEVRSGWGVRMKQSKLSRKEQSRSQAMRCKKKILYYWKTLNQNAAKMMLEMKQGDTGSIQYLFLPGATQHTAMVFQSPVCLFAFFSAVRNSPRCPHTDYWKWVFWAYRRPWRVWLRDLPHHRAIW